MHFEVLHLDGHFFKVILRDVSRITLRPPQGVPPSLKVTFRDTSGTGQGNYPQNDHDTTTRTPQGKVHIVKEVLPVARPDLLRKGHGATINNGLRRWAHRVGPFPWCVFGPARSRNRSGAVLGPFWDCSVTVLEPCPTRRHCRTGPVCQGKQTTSDPHVLRTRVRLESN